MSNQYVSELRETVEELIVAARVGHCCDWEASCDWEARIKLYQDCLDILRGLPNDLEVELTVGLWSEADLKILQEIAQKFHEES